jgi:DNA (cytosine-5)-methyltransferase 1
MRGHELIVDSFAGGGGASTGMEAATGRPVDVAINHNPKAIAMHAANHPHTRHYTCDVWEVDPREATRGQPVGLAWFSPDCRHFSRAKGAKPVRKEIRGLAWVAVRWAQQVRPRVIILENVTEFETWGPLDAHGRPREDAKGETFKRWVRKLRQLGYAVEWRYLVAADYGAPTTRRRLYLVARCDGLPIVWPDATHGEGLLPYVPAHAVIDWSLRCPSVFERTRPLADATLDRLAEGIRRFVLTAAEPFILRHGHYSTRTGAGLRHIPGGPGTWRGQSLHQPMTTVCATDDRHLVAPHVVKHYGGVYGHRADATLGTITARDHHSLCTTLLERAGAVAPTGERSDQVAAFLAKYYGTGSVGQDVREPLHTITSKARFAVVQVEGVPHRIADVGMRMLSPRELYRAQGFPDSYVIDQGVGGRRLSKADQIAMCGNSVSPFAAEAITRAQLSATHGSVAA